MIRFIVERHKADFNAGLERRDFITLDVDVPDLEALMLRGGHGEMGFDSWRLLGAEIIAATPAAGQGET